jgi:predicted nucleic acid-binding protein
MVTARRALADTSIFVGLESRRFDASKVDGYEWGISAITLGELRLGVLQAADPEAVSRRLSTFQLAQRFEALPVDEAVSDSWALLVSKLRAAGRKAPINDSWIAATAIAHRIPVVTQDNDYDDMPDLEVIKIAVSGQPVSPGETPEGGAVESAEEAD